MHSESRMQDACVCVHVCLNKQHWLYNQVCKWHARKTTRAPMPKEQQNFGERLLVALTDDGPYFAGVNSGSKHNSHWERVVTLVGTLLHISVWTLAVVYDSQLLLNVFNDPDHPHFHALMLGAFIPLSVAAASVIAVTLLHIVSANNMCCSQLSFNDGHLPPFITTIILGSIRTSVFFTQLLVAAYVFNGDAAGNEMSTATRDLLIFQVFLKHIGISYTTNSHRFSTTTGFVAAQ